MSTDKIVIDDIYNYLLSLQIELDIRNVPTPSYIQGKIIKCNDLQRQVEKHYLNIKRRTTLLEKNFRIKKVEVEIRKRDILTNNSKAKSLPTVKEREAFADGLLESVYTELLTLENDLNEFRSLLDSIKLVERNLKSTNSDIKALIRIMEQQIGRLNVGTHDDPEVSGLSRDLDDISDLEEEIDLDDVEESTEFVPPNEGGTVPTPVEDESEIEISSGENEEDSFEDKTIDLSLDTGSEDDIKVDEIFSEDIVGNTDDDSVENEITLSDDGDDVISIDEEESDNHSKPLVSKGVTKTYHDPDGLPDLDAFLEGGTESNSPSSSASKDLNVSLMDGIDISEEGDLDFISTDDIIMVLDGEPDEKKPVPAPVVKSKGSVKVDSSKGLADLGFDDTVIDMGEVDLEDEKDPYGLGELKPGTLASILKEPQKSIDEFVNKKEVIVEEVVEEDLESIILGADEEISDEDVSEVDVEDVAAEEDADEGIDIDDLLDNM